MTSVKLFEPGFNLGGTVSSVIINHQMERSLARKLTVDASKEFQELLMPVSLVTVSDNLALEQIERSK